VLRLVLFYLPLTASALLASLTHVIINAVLARSPHPDLTISGYAVALSLCFILEQAIAPLRQTSAKYVRDRHSFRQMVRMIAVVLGCLAAFNALIAWTPVGRYFFHYIYGADESLLDSTVHAYQILLFVNVFSAARSLYQGIIIQQLQTRWMTIGIVIRLVAMAALSWLMVSWGYTDDSRYGALLFLIGMAIETVVACWEGHHLASRLPERLPPQSAHAVRTWKLDIFPFYMPLLYGSLVSIVIGPATQTTMNHSVQPILAIAAFAVASNLTGLISGLATFLHQAVLNFQETEPRRVKQLTAAVTALSVLIQGFLSWTPWGHAVLVHGLHLQGELLQATLLILNALLVRTAVFPWIDYVNGLAMYHGVSKAIAWSKIGSVSCMLTLLYLLVTLRPEWNGMIPAIAGSFVTVFELALNVVLLRRAIRRKEAAAAERRVSA